MFNSKQMYYYRLNRRIDEVCRRADRVCSGATRPKNRPFNRHIKLTFHDLRNMKHLKAINRG